MLKQVRKRNLNKYKKAKTMTKKQLKENKIVYEKGIESDVSIESERDLDRDARKTNRARIIVNEDEYAHMKRDKKGHKMDKKAKKERKERKKQKKERRRARREQYAVNVSPNMPQIDEMVQEEDEEEKCNKCATRSPEQGKCIQCQLKELSQNKYVEESLGISKIEIS